MVLTVVFLVCILTGCGKQEDRGEYESVVIKASEAIGGEGTAESPQKAPLSWQADYFRLENAYDMALAADQALYGCYTREGQVLLNRIEWEEASGKETLPLPDGASMLGMAADREGNVYFLENRADGTFLRRLEADSRLADGAELALEGVGEENEPYLRGVYTDADGHLYVWCRMILIREEDREIEVWSYVDRVYVKDEAFQTIYYEEIADVKGVDVLSFQLAADRKPFFVIKDLEGIYMQEMDVAKQTLKDAVRLDAEAISPDGDLGNGPEHIAAVDGGFLYCRNNALFLFDMEQQEAERLLDLSTYGIFSEDIVYLGKRGDGIEIIDNHGSSGYSERIILALGEAQKTTVTLGVVWLSQDLERAVAEFNRYNEAYQVEIVDYIRMAGEYERAIEKLRLDVVTGSAPDLLAAAGIANDYQAFAQKGALADLYELMEGDGEISRDMLLESVAGACEEEGRLYSVAPSFQLQTMWGYRDVTGGRSGVTFEELFQLLADSGKDLNAIGGFAADEPVLTRLCTVSMDEFVDWKNGTCRFDGEYFKEVLSFAKEYTGNYTGGTYSERIRSREVVLSVGILSSVADYQLQKELYGGDVAVIGYPVAEGTGTAVAFRGSAVAVNAKTEDKTGAWEFVKFYLRQGYDGQGFPVMEELFWQVMKEAMEETTEENRVAAGEEVIVREDGEAERLPKEYYNDGGGQIFVYAASQEEVDAVVALIEGADGCARGHQAIQNIINEEAEAYFAGQADLDRAAETIQNRVTLMLQEMQ